MVLLIVRKKNVQNWHVEEKGNLEKDNVVKRVDGKKIMVNTGNRTKTKSVKILEERKIVKGETKKVKKTIKLKHIKIVTTT